MKSLKKKLIRETLTDAMNTALSDLDVVVISKKTNKAIREASKQIAEELKRDLKKLAKAEKQKTKSPKATSKKKKAKKKIKEPKLMDATSLSA
jgi:hypothetical protein